MILKKTFENRAKLLNSNFGVLYYTRVLDDMVIFHIVISPACEIADTQYYRAWEVGARKRFSVLVIGYFHNYLVILNRVV